MRWDVIIIGARCSGSSVARLLATQGANVLLVDKVNPTSDVVSTHCITLPGIQMLTRWNLLEPLLKTNVPLVKSFQVYVNSTEVHNVFGPGQGAWTIAPRRSRLDRLLLTAAIQGGAKILINYTLEDLIVEDGRVVGVTLKNAAGRFVQERARVVVGADGRTSKTGRLAGAKLIWLRESPIGGCYGYFTGLPSDLAKWYFSQSSSAGVFPTNDNLACVWAMTDVTSPRLRKEGSEALFYRALRDADHTFAEQVEASKHRFRRVQSFGAHPGILRKRFGPGWVLVGDAGYYRHPITAHGITDAFRDAALLAEGLRAYLQGSLSWDHALARYEQRQLSVITPIFEATQALAAGQWYSMAPVHLMTDYKAAVKNEIKCEAEWWGRCDVENKQ
jgi:2-polyprenyl-6-methoxyphenol hydroxylase-like FAD-dependent oxidoreductase